MNTELQIGGPHAESYRYLIDNVRENRVKLGFFGWVSQQVGRLISANDISEYVEVSAQEDVIDADYEEADELNEIDYLVENIPGIAQKRAKDLLQTFGSIDNIRKAEYAQIIQIKGIKDKLAKSILEFFKYN